ncbi:hypothetical protein [Burkholderia sp. Bp8984]|uniref:hypothetical protein n=1 Tax=Burkholderia sp. Bp8984 TaxID=2184549 RepID=UPI000F598F16|nr:hypothetical protein [Burkholderia sp. Bp8984]RQS63831.1 hypothetical protein DID98_02820 [Burkholderia sp. Bp8984]
MSHEIRWLDEPEAHDYTAALSYLSLHVPIKMAGDFVHALRQAGMSEFKAKDIFRASGLPLLSDSNSHVKRNLEKIEHGKRLSPVLLVRGTMLTIADGYHRVCAVYMHDEDAMIPCKIVGSEA